MTTHHNTTADGTVAPFPASASGAPLSAPPAVHYAIHGCNDDCGCNDYDMGWYHCCADIVSDTDDITGTWQPFYCRQHRLWECVRVRSFAFRRACDFQVLEQAVLLDDQVHCLLRRIGHTRHLLIRVPRHIWCAQNGVLIHFARPGTRAVSTAWHIQLLPWYCDGCGCNCKVTCIHTQPYTFSLRRTRADPAATLPTSLSIILTHSEWEMSPSDSLKALAVGMVVVAAVSGGGGGDGGGGCWLSLYTSSKVESIPPTSYHSHDDGTQRRHLPQTFIVSVLSLILFTRDTSIISGMPSPNVCM